MKYLFIFTISLFITSNVFSSEFENTLKLAQQGDAEAQYRLGEFFLKGLEGVPVDAQKALEWYFKAAEQGHESAKEFICFAGTYFDENKFDALCTSFKDILKRAKDGNVEAQREAGFRLWLGIEGAPQDYKQSFNWLLKAAAQGDAAAQYMISVFYSSGYGVEVSKSEAFKWCKKSAEQGHESAQLDLGHMYSNGSGVSENLIEAFKWYKKAAINGNPKAQYITGIFYELKADEQQLKGSTYDVKDLADGYHLEMMKNRAEAHSLFLKSARQGFGDAQGALSAAYVSGKHGPENYIQAFVWASMAKAQGVEKGESLLSPLKVLMTLEQRAKAQELASKCWESNFKDCDE